jgi:WhiB family redox-sensing transcriptional regulator
MGPTTTKETRRGLPSLTRGANWRDQAACRHADPDLFFPDGTTGPALRQVDEAKRICRACPARTPCLAWALGNAIPAGIWGGTTEEERRAIRSTRIRRGRRRAAQAATAYKRAL